MLNDPENFYSLDKEESIEFLDEYTRSEYDTYNDPYSDYDYDMDNYGYRD